MATILNPFFNTDNETDGVGGANDLGGARGVAAVTLNGVTYVYAAANSDRAVQILSLDATGTMTPVGSIRGGGASGLNGTDQVEIVQTASDTFLLVKGLESYNVLRVDPLTGGLAITDALSDNGTRFLGGIGDIESVDIGGVTYVFIAAQSEDAVNVYSLDPVTGVLAFVEVVRDVDNASYELNRVEFMHTANVGGAEFLFAAGRQDNGISVFSIDAAGHLTNVFNVSNATAPISNPTGLATLDLGGRTFLFVANSGTGTIATFEVDAAGALTFLSVAGGTYTSVSALTVSVIDGVPMLFASVVGENALIALEVAADGSLTEVAEQSDTIAARLRATAFNTVVNIGEDSFLLATGENDNGISAFAIGAGDDVLGGTTGADRMIGLGGDDVLAGKAGVDDLFGGSGDDVLLGQGGNDALQGGAGADSLLGGAGIDTIKYVGSGAVAVDLAAGTVSGGHANGDFILAIENVVGSGGGDTIIGDAGANRLEGLGGSDTIDGGEGDNILLGGGGNDSIAAGGGNDDIAGGAGNDVLSAGDGANTLAGAAGNDSLLSGAGDDVLSGGVGRDTLAAGAGTDSLTGGTKRDEFVFTDGDGADVITDFLVGTDRIDLRGHVGATDFASLIRFNVPAQGVLVQIDADDSIFILGVTNAELLASDFLF